MSNEEAKEPEHIEPEPFEVEEHEKRRWGPFVIAAVLVTAAALLLIFGGYVLQSRNVRFLKYKENAASFLAGGEFSRAISFYQRALALNPNDLETKESIANCRLRSGDLPQAIEDYHECLRDKPDDTHLQLTVASLYLLAKNISRSREIADFILQNEPDNVLAIAMDAQCHYEQTEDRPPVLDATMVLDILPSTASPYNLPTPLSGVGSTPEEAEKRLLQAVETNPDKVQPHKDLADFYRRQKRFPDAEKEYKKMVEIAPKDPYVHLHLADFYRAEEVGQLTEAIGQYSEILRNIDSRNLFALRGITGLSIASGDLPSAEKYSKRLIWEQPSDTFGRYFRGILKLYAKEIPAAERDLLFVTKERSEYARGHYLLGYARLLNRQLAEGKKSLEQAVKVDPTFARPRLLLAEIAFNLGQYQKALEALDKVLNIEKEKTNPLPYLLRGRIYLTQNDPTQAEEPFTRLAELDPQSIYPKLLLGEVYKRIAKNEQAESQYQAAIAANPDSALACYLLGFLYEKMGEPDLAMVSYEKSVEKAPTLVIAARKLADAYVRNSGGENADAKEIGKTFLEKFPNNFTLVDTLGTVFYERREFPKAIEVFELIPQQERESRPQIVYHYAAALYRGGKNAQARKELQKAAQWLRNLPTPGEIEKTLQEIISEEGIVG